MDGEFGRLVDATEGPQPFRRLFHAGAGVCIAAMVLVLRPYPSLAALVLSILVAILLASDLVRLRVPAVNSFFFKTFRTLASPREAGGIASSTWYIMGILLAVLFFPRDIVVPSILVLATADPAASYVGRRWGRKRVGTGSVEGVTVFVATATVVLTFWVSPVRALFAATAGALVEIIPWRLDDNLTIPLTVAATLWLLGAT